MGDLTTLAKARRELEELYLGVPDESVNLTFGDLAEVKKKQNSMEPIQESNSKAASHNLHKLPSLDFSRAMQQQGSNNNNDNHHHNQLPHHHNNHHHVPEDSFGHRHHHLDEAPLHLHASHDHHRHGNEENYQRHPPISNHHSGFRSHGMDHSVAYDDVSGISMASMSPYPEGPGRRRRPGIPHSNICTICTTYAYIFRHRCLVCGRVYCRHCVSVGMGEMTEGRKCVECLGKKFSQRYIQRAGKMGCCSTYPSLVKQQELKWAEKGPRRSGERGDNRSRTGMMASRSRSPMTPRTPTRAHAASNPPSFVMNSPYSPYSPTHHHLPF